MFFYLFILFVVITSNFILILFISFPFESEKNHLKNLEDKYSSNEKMLDAHIISLNDAISNLESKKQKYNYLKNNNTFWVKVKSTLSNDMQQAEFTIRDAKKKIEKLKEEKIALETEQIALKIKIKSTHSYNENASNNVYISKLVILYFIVGLFFILVIPLYFALSTIWTIVSLYFGFTILLSSIFYFFLENKKYNIAMSSTSLSSSLVLQFLIISNNSFNNLFTQEICEIVKNVYDIIFIIMVITGVYFLLLELQENNFKRPDYKHGFKEMTVWVGKIISAIELLIAVITIFAKLLEFFGFI